MAIPNLTFISKILEQVVANRLNSHIFINGLTNASQSAYKQFHSTETALLKVHNDINLNIHYGKVTALTLLDLSAAFDTIDYDILITRLSTWYGIYGTALSFFTSYLSDRRQAIKIGNCILDMLLTSCGVPQGSVLGLLLFTLYTTPLSSVIQSHNLDHHLYADDTQIYVSLPTPDTCRSLNQLRDCLQDVSRWMRNSSNPLYIPRVKTNAGARAFSVAEPTVWNSLPTSVKSKGNIVSFRRRLKTFIFNAAYPPWPPSFFIHSLRTHALFSITSLLNPLVLSRYWA